MEGRLKKRLSRQEDEEEEEEEYLFHTPADLVCPITHELFKDPVLNSAGQMYEKEAFLQYLESTPNAVDPISRVPLQRGVLMGVVKTRGSALEYREHVSRICVEKACKSDCKQPMKYLKRAADLCSPVGLQVPGLSQECISQLQEAVPEGEDRLALSTFAEGLLQMGDCDKAAAVYYNLFRACEDKEQQAGLLKQCVECWSTGTGPVDSNTVQKLTEFVRGQESFTWGQLIDIMQKGNIDETLILRLCEELLMSQDAGGEEPPWNEQKDVLMKYIIITSHILKDKQEWTESEVQRIMEWREKILRAREPTRPRSIQPISSLREQRKPLFLRKKFVVSFLFCVASLVEGHHLAFRLARVFSVLYMFNSTQAQ